MCVLYFFRIQTFFAYVVLHEFLASLNRSALPEVFDESNENISAETRAV